MQQKELGYLGEKIAAHYLISLGYKIIEQNFTIHGGELDIIAHHKQTLIFVEVKTRTSNRFGDGQESIDYKKRVRMERAICRYISGHFPYHEPPYRIELITLKLEPNNHSIMELNHLELE